MKTCKQLINALTLAFLDQPSPSRIVESEGGGFEPSLVKAFFAGKHWKEITLKALDGYHSDSGACLGFMAPEAFRYFLPAYLLMILEDYEVTSGRTIYSSTLFFLNANNKTSGECWRVRYLEPLTKKQKKIIADILVYERSLHDEQMGGYAEEALQSYWSQFL